MATYELTGEELANLLAAQADATTFGPQTTSGFSWLEAVEGCASPDAMRQARSAQSAKGLLQPATECVGCYGKGTSAATATETGEIVLLGVRACGLRARTYLDKVLMEGQFQDPFYQARREATTTISCDCVECAPTCFCTLVGGKPYSTEGYDVNLTPVDGEWIVEVATDKGRAWLQGQLGDNASLREATGEQLKRRDEIRREMTERVAKQNESFSFSAADDQAPQLPNDNDDAWQAFAADCVECGACTNICPTCHCFYLYDKAGGGDAFERVRTWDSCLLSTYHRMAGGVHMKLSPRPKLSSRLANRVLHKFDYSPKQYGLLGCVGCGRCIDACLGAIDIRQVVEELKG